MAVQKPDQTPDRSSLGARLRASDAFADVRDYVETGSRPEDDVTAPFVGLADLGPDPGEQDLTEAEDALEAPGRRRHAVLLGSMAMAGVIGVAAAYAVVSGGWAGTWNPDGSPGGAPPEYSRPSGEAPTAVPSTTGSRSLVTGGTPSGSPKPGSSPDATPAPDVKPPGATPKPTRTSTPPSEPTPSPTGRPSKKPPRPKPTPTPTPSKREHGLQRAAR